MKRRLKELRKQRMERLHKRASKQKKGGLAGEFSMVLRVRLYKGYLKIHM